MQMHKRGMAHWPRFRTIWFFALLVIFFFCHGSQSNLPWDFFVEWVCLEGVPVFLKGEEKAGDKRGQAKVTVSSGP